MFYSGQTQICFHYVITVSTEGSRIPLEQGTGLSTKR